MDVLTHAIYEFLSLKVFYIVIGATTLVYVYIHSLRSKNTQLSHVKNNKSRSSCNSPNCVRCNKYREITTLAKTRFRDILSKHEVQNNKIKLSFDLFVDDKLRNSRACTDQNPEVYELGGLFARHWWNSIHFERTKIEDDLKVLMENFQIINEEYKSFIKNPSCINHFKLNDTERGKWSVCHLFNQGQEVKNNTEHFPETVHVLNSLSTAMLKNVFGNAVFSSLNPNTNIEEHYGPTDIRLRCHLGKIQMFHLLIVCNI